MDSTTALTTILKLLTLALTFHLLRTLKSLYNNYLSARQTGLRTVIVPVHPYGLPWQILSFLMPSILQHFRWARLLDLTWSWQDNNKPATAWGLGETFIIVSPSINTIYTSDKTAIEHILTRRKDFIKGEIYSRLNFYGRNVDTVNGEEWARHRKLTAPCFNERVSGLVWDESRRQSASMVQKWTSQPRGKVAGMVDDTRIVALHVLDAAGFGVQHDFFGGVREPQAGHRLSRRDALMTVLDNIIASVVLALLAPRAEVLERWTWGVPLGERFGGVVLALREFGAYMDEAVDGERRAGAGKANLISTMIRTADREREDAGNADGAGDDGAGVKGVWFTDSEIKGNIFIFNLAGHDTTANTLAYAFALLACWPAVQDWVAEEIDDVVGDGDWDGGVVYEEVFPRLKRVLAVMYETLRLYGPVPRIPRAVPHPNTTLPLSSPTSSSSITIPANTELTLQLHAMHTSSSNFANPTVWDPKRWISSSTPNSSPPGESFIHAGISQGYAAWSHGPRICPGMKMAQVEFVAVLGTVLRGVRVTPAVTGDDEVGEEGARDVVLGLVRESAARGPTLSFERPGEVCLRVEKRCV
ncbi:cytochrome P450 [Byssothecium circinans]|uniref:Cytochrome P450 n=1 Tax=Byssothecium circinans TaxID=147558 RepID=A0A6A5URQ8_9PLEO|nr:cytochrome P450 [Byssothecium circinans]